MEVKKFRYEKDHLMDDEKVILKNAFSGLTGSSAVVKNLVSGEGDNYLLKAFFFDGDDAEPDRPYEERELLIETSCLMDCGLALHQQNFHIVNGEVADFFTRTTRLPTSFGDHKCEVEYGYLGATGRQNIEVPESVELLAEVICDLSRVIGMEQPQRSIMKRIHQDVISVESAGRK